MKKTPLGSARRCQRRPRSARWGAEGVACPDAQRARLFHRAPGHRNPRPAQVVSGATRSPSRQRRHRSGRRRRGAGPRRSRPHHPAGRVLRPPRSQWCRQDDYHRHSHHARARHIGAGVRRRGRRGHPRRTGAPAHRRRAAASQPRSRPERPREPALSRRLFRPVARRHRRAVRLAARTAGHERQGRREGRRPLRRAAAAADDRARCCTSRR